MDDNFDGQNFRKHHMESCFPENKCFLQINIAFIAAADMILKIIVKAAKNVAVKGPEFLETSIRQSSDFSEGLSSLRMCSKLYENNTCEKLTGLEMKPSTVSTITGSGTEERHMSRAIDA